MQPVNSQDHCLGKEQNRSYLPPFYPRTLPPSLPSSRRRKQRKFKWKRVRIPWGANFRPLFSSICCDADVTKGEASESCAVLDDRNRGRCWDLEGVETLMALKLGAFVSFDQCLPWANCRSVGWREVRRKKEDGKRERTVAS